MCLSNEDLFNTIENNVIGNNSYTCRDVINANKLFGSNVASLKGKTVWRKSKLPREDATIDIPPAIIDQFKEGITLSIGIMHVNKVSFLVSNAYHHNYYQCIPICKKGKEYILGAIEQMWNEYKQRGVFKFTQIEGDSAFEWAMTELQSDRFEHICLITCDAQKHVLRIERGIKQLKYPIQSTKMVIQYNKIPKRFAIEMVKEVTKLVISPIKEECMLYNLLRC